MNLKGDYIYRYHDEYFYTLPNPQKRPRSIYPWEKEKEASLVKINKDFFRCKGFRGNPPRVDPKTKKIFYDCQGALSHSLPMKNDREFIYPILIDILNAVQKKIGKQVKITSACSCRQHYEYIGGSNPFSKRLKGAKVDFYVQGIEHHPQKVVEAIDFFYITRSKKLGSDYSLKVLKKDVWQNPEILLKIKGCKDHRNRDNFHPYPYLTIEVLFDVNRGQVVD
ncbi:MAG: D-Ala-D-Ala carboxypeptidase family metallohydrolase [Rhabdochlamydiaceae bacterium]